jgi:hypothetical protein
MGILICCHFVQHCSLHRTYIAQFRKYIKNYLFCSDLYISTRYKGYDLILLILLYVDFVLFSQQFFNLRYAHSPVFLYLVMFDIIFKSYFYSHHTESGQAYSFCLFWNSDKVIYPFRSITLSNKLVQHCYISHVSPQSCMKKKIVDLG